MAWYLVSIEKRAYKTGLISVGAESPEQAEEIVQQRIAAGDLQTVNPEIVWNDDYEYEDDTFTTTGDVQLE